MSNSSIMSVKEMIDATFGDEDLNVVNFKLMQTILYVLARQLRILERRVEIEVIRGLKITSSTSLSISEVKMQAPVQKKGAKAIDSSKPKDKGASDKVVTTVSGKSVKSTSEKTPSTSDRTTTSASTKTPTSSDKTTTEDKTSSSDKSKRVKTSEKVLFLSEIEEMREMELRVIHQRKDSHDEGPLSPTPMASITEEEMQFEKLLVVDRVPADRVSGESNERIPRLSVVTKDQFSELQQVVQQIQMKFAAVGNADFPDNAQLMDDLRRGASLTDAMAALQLSARLEAAEKALNQMSSIVTDLVKKLPKGKNTQTKTETQVLFGGPDDQEKETRPARKTKTGDEISTKRMSTQKLERDAKPDSVSFEELEKAMKALYDEFVKTVTGITKKSSANADNALKIATKLEFKIEEAKALEQQMADLEVVVSEYTDQINALDTGLSSQMTNYQEELTQMQHDLETGLETMAEALANTGGDTAAVAELNNQFSILQTDIEHSHISQLELKNKQNALSVDLQALWKQIEILRETKADRDEVVDALKDKAGIGALNGLVSLQQFDAVRGDIEKKIKAAYDKFNNQESIWQKVIDDLFRELNEKAAWIQVDALREDINANLEKLRKKIQSMLDIVGEPKAAALTRQIHRDSNCLSCATAAHMELESDGVPCLPGLHKRSPTIGAESSNMPREDGDHGVCIPGQPIRHARDPRSHICQRWCGGSHTKINNTVSRVPPSMILTKIDRKFTTGIGTDGKAYMMDESYPVKPCLECNSSKAAAPEPSEAETGDKVPDFPENVVDFGSDMTPEDFRMTSVTAPLDSVLSNTPPPILDNFDMF